MRKRPARPLKELYSLTEPISAPEITPVLEGSCRIQGPVDESEHALSRTNSGILPGGKNYTFVNDSLHMRTESGTCNVCSAPCSSCMHDRRTVSAMESNIVCRRKETDSCSFIGDDGVPFYKSRICDDSHAASETSNLHSASSSHDSYSENAESKATLRAAVTYDASEDFDKPQKGPLGVMVEEHQEHQYLMEKANVKSNRRISSIRDEEQHGLECHGDNISCITGARDSNVRVGGHNLDLDKKDAVCGSVSTGGLPTKGIENVVQVEITDCSHGGENEESQTNCGKIMTCPKESLHKKSSGSTPPSSDKSDLEEFAVHKSNTPPKVCHPCSHSQSGCISCANDGFKGSGGSSGSQLHVDGGTSFGLPPAGGNVAEQMQTSLPDYEGSNASHIRTGSLSGTDSCVKTENCTDGGVSLDTGRNSSAVNEQSEKPRSLVEASDLPGSEVQPQPTMDDENSESDVELDDVKVCDICGDAGREDLLAICSRCSDGAEHTYCMREMLREVPEGDWLCEECHMKETEKNKVDIPEPVSEASKECKAKVDAENKVARSEMAFETSKESNQETENKDTENRKGEKSEILSSTLKLSCSKATSQNFERTTSSKLSKLDAKAVDLNGRGSPKGQQISAKRHAENQEVISMSGKKAFESTGGSVEAASPRKKSALSRESSFKNLDTGRTKPANIGPACEGQSANKPQAFSRSQSSLGSNLSKVQAQLQLPSRTLLKSASFNNVNSKPKVKQLTEKVPLKTKMSRESASCNTRKEALVRSMGKSSSFKSISRSRSDLASKSLLHQSRVEDPKVLKEVKEKSVMEKKNASILDRPLGSPSPRSGSSIPFPKVDMKVAQHDGKLNNTSDSAAPSLYKGSDDANLLRETEVKKQSTYSSKSLGSAYSKAKGTIEGQKPLDPKEGARSKPCNTAEPVSQRCLSQPAESTQRDDKNRDATIFNNSRQAAPGGNRVLRCQKCNETGHSTQFCSIDKLRVSALKPLAERSLKDVNKKGSKWKDAVDATILKSRIHKVNKDQSDELSASITELNCEVASKEDFQLKPSNLPRNMSLEERIDGQGILRLPGSDSTKPAHSVDLAMQVVQPFETSCPPGAGGLNATTVVLDQLNLKPSMPILPVQASLLANSSRTSAIPELDFIWQGSFEVLSTGRVPGLFGGIQAHLSTCASPKVLEVVTKFPCIVQLDEVSRISTWPLQFQGISPKEENIALFFFAKDVESYERSYSKLLENMIKNDLALKGSISGVELLIFPSNKLPVNSQRWNRLFFLWGLFRGRKADCLKAAPDSVKKTCGPVVNMVPLVQNLSSTVNPSVYPFQKPGYIDDPEKQSSSCDGSAKRIAVESATCVDALHTSSSEIEDRMCHTQELPPVVCQSAAEDRQQLGQVSCTFPKGSPLRGMDKLSVLDTHPGSTSTTQSFPEVKSDGTYLKNLVSGSGGKYVTNPLAPVHPSSEQSYSNRASPSYTVSLDCKQGIGSGRDQNKLTEKEGFVKSEAALDSDLGQNPTETNHVSWESRPSRKRVRSSSAEATSQVPDEISKSNWAVLLSKDRENCLSMDDVREQKKMCYSEGQAGISFREETSGATLSSKVHPFLASSLTDQRHTHPGDLCDEGQVADSSRSAERFFFPVEPNPVRNTINILSSDDEDAPESITPDLELALGGRKRTPKQEVFPLLFQPVNGKANQEKPLVPAADTGEDVSASLSLSLAFPSPPKPILKSEQLLPEGPHVNTSLLLFGPFTDT